MRVGIGTKLMVLAGIGSLVLVLVGFYGVWSFWGAIHNLHSSLGNAADIQHAILDNQREYKTEIQEWKNVLLRGTDEASLKKRWDAYEAQHLKVIAEAAAVMQKTGSKEAKDALEKFIQENLRNYEAYRKAVLLMKENGFDARSADRAVQGIDRPTVQYIEAAVHAIEREAGAIGSSVVGDAEFKIRLISVVAAIVFVIEGICFVLLIRRHILRPTGIVLSGLNTLKSGDFTGALPRLANDEFGDIAEATQQVSQELGKLVSSVSHAADSLSQTAQRVAMVSSMTSEGVRNQREETDHASRAMVEMSQSMEQAVGNAVSAVEIAGGVSNQVFAVNSVMSETVHTVRSLAEGVKDTVGAIQALKDETQSIGEVAKTIRNIADQTNLLALNAAIEAARAGEHGRGFAVVADEVRKLANITQEATGIIEKRIATLQAGAGDAMAAMLEGSERADKSIAQADETRRALDSITQAAASIREVNERIATVLEGQKGIAGTISGTLTNISQTAEQTSHSSRKTTEEVAGVAAEAVKLHQMVSKFTVAEGGHEASPQEQTDTKDESVELF